MPFLKHILSPFLCCFGGRLEQREDQAVSDLQTLPSALNLPASEIPHAVDGPGSYPLATQALRELSRQPSSIRGYRTASIPSGSLLHRESSFDADVSFGPQEQPRKPASRLGQLGNHIKQKLSESGLSKTGSRPHLASEDDNSLPTKNGAAENVAADLCMKMQGLSLSPRSTGLLNILQSHTASDGGYDSDAKSIKTDMMMMSREGTMQLSAERARTLLSSSIDLGYVATDGTPAPPPPEVKRVADEVNHLHSTHNTSPFDDAKLSVVQAAQQKSDQPPGHPSLKFHDRDTGDGIQFPHSSQSKSVHPFAALGNEEQDPFTTKPAPVNSASDDFISTCSERASMDIAPVRPHDRAMEATYVPRGDISDALMAALELLTSKKKSPRRTSSSTFTPENRSLHLYDMNISKFLAPSSSHTTTLGFEHNRRPSDPRTRCLFEGSIVIPRPPQDASSLYSTGGVIGDYGQLRCRPVLKNPNSIAVGGRSESINLPVGPSSRSPSLAEESFWFGRRPSQRKPELESNSTLPLSATRNRSVSMPGDRTEKEKQAARPTRDELMTEISVEAIQDVRNERMSEVGHDDRNVATASQSTHPTASVLDSKPRLLESTTNVWQKSFKRALEEPHHDSLGGFLSLPKFDREGRRRNSKSSIGAVQAPQEHQSRSIAIAGPRKEGFNTFGPSKTLRKRSLLDIGRRFSGIGASPEPNRKSGSSTPLKELLGSWGRFPSHAREQRCESAGAEDGVAVRDFALECQRGDRPLHATRGSLTLPRRSKNNRKTMAGRLKKLYRTSSMDFQSYSRNYGHRSSVSVGGSVEYPELEVIPGSPGCGSDFDGTSEKEHQRRGEGAVREHLKPGPPIDAEPWTKTYRDCVGSISALKSSVESSSMSLHGALDFAQHRSVTLGDTSSADLMENTVKWGERIEKECEATKESLLHKLENL